MVRRSRRAACGGILRQHTLFEKEQGAPGSLLWQVWGVRDCTTALNCGRETVRATLGRRFFLLDGFESELMPIITMVGEF